MLLMMANARRRVATLALVGGGALAAYLLGPHVPRDRTVQLRFESAATVTGVEVAWTPSREAGAREPDALQGAAWRFGAGTAPARLDMPVRLPDGRYRLDVTVVRGAEQEQFQRPITLGDSDHMTVSLR